LRSDPPPAEKEFWEVWGEERAAAPSDKAPAAAPIDGAQPSTSVEPRTEYRPEPVRRETPDNVTRLYLNLGRKDGASEEEIRNLLSAHTGAVDVSEIDVMNTHTYLNVAPADAEKIVGALTGKEMSGRQLVCEQAKPRRR
jgi:DbpA-like RNA binding protein